jgi:hypothetical protein
MNIKIKSAIMLISVLLIGIIFGAVGSTLLRRDLLQDRLERFRKPTGFVERMIHIIEPEKSQIENIETALLNHHHRMMQQNTMFRERMSSLSDSLLSDLKAILTPEQLERAEKFIKQGRPFPGPGRRGKERPHRERF